MRSGVWLCLLCLAAPGLARGADSEGTITVRLEGFRNDKGEAMLLLFRSKDGFPSRLAKAVKTEKAAISGGKAEVKLGPLPLGTYAVCVIHDENRNGKLDMFLGIPREGWGMSNNPKTRTRVPRFDETKFELDAESKIVVVKMAYF